MCVCAAVDFIGVFEALCLMEVMLSDENSEKAGSYWGSNLEHLASLNEQAAKISLCVGENGRDYT